jgi:uncharacterized membrane protein
MRYDILVFVHVLAAIAWIGSGFLLQVLAQMANRRRDEATFGALVGFSNALALKLFVPASLTVLVFGLLVVADGPWTLGQLWVVLGLVGFAATFLTGLLVLKPRGDRLAPLIERDGGRLGPEATAQARQLLALGQIDYVVLVVVVFDMVAKPTGDDHAQLVLMALVLLGGLAVVLGRARRLDEPAPAVR